MKSLFYKAPSHFVAVAAGGHVGMALRADGTVAAWGAFGAAFGSIIGSIIGPDGRAFVPEGLVGVKAIATSGDHCLAVKDDGTVVSWGVDDRSRLAVPRSLTRVTAVAAGRLHSLALKRDGTVVAWGDNSSGSCDVPVGLTDVMSIAIVGWEGHSIAIRRDGTTVVWGGWGEKLEGLDGRTNVLSTDGSIILRRDNTVVNTDGTPPRSIVAEPHKVEMLEIPSNITAIAGPLLLHADGTVSCLGDHMHSDELTVPHDLTGVQEIAAGDGFALALKEDGTIVGWGRNAEGQLDLPPAEDFASQTNAPSRTYPTHVSDIESPRRFVAVAAGWEHSVALRSDGTVAAWGSNNRGQLDIPENLTGVVQIAAGEKHSIALLSDGTVVTWGRTVGGPIDQPDGLSDVIAVAAGQNQNLALTRSGAVILWEQSFAGTEKLPDDWANVIAVAIGAEPIALRRDGTVLTGHRVRGIGPAPLDIDDVSSVAVSCSTPYALQRDGTVVTWGESFDPIEELRYASGRAVRFPNPSGIVAISAGWRHALAVSGSGTLTAWGDNGYGQATVPSGLGNVIDVAAGEAHSLALTSDGDIVAWGLNRDGQLNVPSVESDGVDSNKSRVLVSLVFRARRNTRGTRFWKFGIGQAGTAVHTWIEGYRIGDLVFEDDRSFSEIGSSYYSMMAFRVVEQYFPSSKWEGDFSLITDDPEDEEFPIVVEAKISIRKEDLSASAAGTAAASSSTPWKQA